jgi:perosamine synthetase
VHYPPNHLQAAFAPWRRTLPATERSAAEILSLPFHPDMTQHDVDQVVAALASALLATGASGSTEQAPVCPLLGS